MAVDAETGREVWMTQIADMSEGETTPMAPLVAKDRVIVGASGGEFGIYGWLKGLDLKTGKIVWTGHNIGPDADMLVKPGVFKSFYDKDVTELGPKSWPKDAWKTGGAPVWGWISYDPDLDLLYYGAGNPSPYNTEQRRRRQQVDERACWRAGRRTDRWSGPTSSPRTTTGTTTRPRP